MSCVQTNRSHRNNIYGYLVSAAAASEVFLSAYATRPTDRLNLKTNGFCVAVGSLGSAARRALDLNKLNK